MEASRSVNYAESLINKRIFVPLNAIQTEKATPQQWEAADNRVGQSKLTQHRTGA